MEYDALMARLARCGEERVDLLRAGSPRGPDRRGPVAPGMRGSMGRAGSGRADRGPFSADAVFRGAFRCGEDAGFPFPPLGDPGSIHGPFCFSCGLDGTHGSAVCAALWSGEGACSDCG